MYKKKHVYIYGGLGNQMFQYAFYLSLKKKGVPCVLDASLFLVNKSHNGFELFDVFGIKEDYFCAPSWLGKGYLIYQKLFICIELFITARNWKIYLLYQNGIPKMLLI